MLIPVPPTPTRTNHVAITRRLRLRPVPTPRIRKSVNLTPRTVNHFRIPSSTFARRATADRRIGHNHRTFPSVSGAIRDPLSHDFQQKETKATKEESPSFPSFPSVPNLQSAPSSVALAEEEIRPPSPGLRRAGNPQSPSPRLGADKLAVQPGIDAFVPQQAFMRAALHDPALVQHQHQIGLANRAQAMRHNE